MSARSETSPETTSRIRLWRVVISLNWGRSAAIGKDWMRATADSMSSSATAMSAPELSTTRTDAMPGAATDLTDLTSSSEATCSSILMMIDSSISLGVAPG